MCSISKVKISILRVNNKREKEGEGIHYRQNEGAKTENS